MDKQVDAAIDELVEDARDGAAYAAASEGSEEEAPLRGLRRTPAQGLRRAAQAIHAHDEREREAFFALVLERRSLDDCARELPGGARAVAAGARAVLLDALRAMERARTDASALEGENA